LSFCAARAGVGRVSGVPERVVRHPDALRRFAVAGTVGLVLADGGGEGGGGLLGLLLILLVVYLLFR
jgi:hypothetical protein